MASIDKTAYPRFERTISERELREAYSPSQIAHFAAEARLPRLGRTRMSRAQCVSGRNAGDSGVVERRQHQQDGHHHEVLDVVTGLCAAGRNRSPRCPAAMPNAMTACGHRLLGGTEGSGAGARARTRR
ncbi:hypothetical protein MF672_015985 [Actinomadura sp. ATCC 31491]|uniref:Uncharacterized protein n=1 Tax=Actinomadura luzonensis TaxID=2805427 RepID=A0ABT0FSF1_9ACTN|nr:hypothetical protein [Actinomadura luzonensis]MCK2215277.1 hypothetical protein [Actinomadura luzonensis]